MRRGAARLAEVGGGEHGAPRKHASFYQELPCTLQFRPPYVSPSTPPVW